MTAVRAIAMAFVSVFGKACYVAALHLVTDHGACTAALHIARGNVTAGYGGLLIRFEFATFDTTAVKYAAWTNPDAAKFGVVAVVTAVLSAERAALRNAVASKVTVIAASVAALFGAVTGSIAAVVANGAASVGCIGTFDVTVVVVATDEAFVIALTGTGPVAITSDMITVMLVAAQAASHNDAEGDKARQNRGGLHEWLSTSGGSLMSRAFSSW